ncbi:DUF397 domain-containing protein [Actinospica acidithermotolerans]|uniref:DUF397 domain-containing protein n=1 Tax=Actinospica acidithermotolerans TaxID=2828514 RepID=UPI003556B99B
MWRKSSYSSTPGGNCIEERTCRPASGLSVTPVSLKRTPHLHRRRVRSLPGCNEERRVRRVGAVGRS